MISADDFDAYNKAVADMSDGLAKQVEASILAWMAEHPEASVAECREFAKEAMDGMVQVADDAAATLAAEWYDAQARAAGLRLESAITASVYSPELVDDVARYQAKKLLNGDKQGFAKYCAELVRNDALKSLNETVIANVGRDGGVGMRFARVTTGKEDCDFCLMLESRGAVYWTRKTAGEMRRFHRGCDCKVVPGIAGEPLMTLVEGHDPVDAYSKYLDMIGVPPEEKPARIQAHIDEMVERSWKEPRPQRERRRKWKSKRFGSIDEMRDYALAAESMEDLRERSRVLEEEFKESGLTGRYHDLLKGTVQARKRALLETRSPVGSVSKEPGAKPNDDELNVGSILAELGMDVVFVPESRLAGVKSPDARINGNLWEFKNPTAYGPKTVKNQFKKAIGKGTDKLLISNVANGASLDEIESDVMKLFESGDFLEINEVMLVGADGSIRHMKR